MYNEKKKNDYKDSKYLSHQKRGKCWQGSLKQGLNVNITSGGTSC